MYKLKDIPKDPELKLDKQDLSEEDVIKIQITSIIIRLGATLLTETDEYLKGQKISKGHYLTLLVLLRSPKASKMPSQLADILGVTRANMTGILEELSNNGLIRKIPNKRDRRCVFLDITNKGKKFIEKLKDQIYKHMSLIMPDEKNQNYKDLLKHLRTLEKSWKH